MARNVAKSGLFVICLCMMVVFLIGCTNGQQVKLEQKPETNDQVMLDRENFEQEQVADTFFEVYPENWEHYYYQQNWLAQYTKNSTPSVFYSLHP